MDRGNGARRVLEADEIIEMIYEDALADEEPWAVEAYDFHARQQQGGER